MLRDSRVHMTADVMMFRACWAQGGRCNRFPSTTLGEGGEALYPLLNELRRGGAVRSVVEGIGLRRASMTANCLLCKLLVERVLVVSLAEPYTQQCSPRRRGASQAFVRRIEVSVICCRS
jgi:hypothetical protein